MRCRNVIVDNYPDCCLSFSIADTCKHRSFHPARPIPRFWIGKHRAKRRAFWVKKSEPKKAVAGTPGGSDDISAVSMETTENYAQDWLTEIKLHVVSRKPRCLNKWQSSQPLTNISPTVWSQSVCGVPRWAAQYTSSNAYRWRPYMHRCFSLSDSPGQIN